VKYHEMASSLTVTRTASIPNIAPVHVCFRFSTPIRSTVVHSSVAFTIIWTVVSSITFHIVLNAYSSTVGLLCASVPLCYTRWKGKQSILEENYVLGINNYIIIELVWTRKHELIFYVSEWLLFNTKWATFQLHHVEN